jgi:hypothetical protein
MMTDTGHTPVLSPELRIRLAVTGADIRRWYALRRLWNEMHAAGGSSEALDELTAALDQAFEAAADESDEVADLLEANADQINAILASDHRAPGAPADLRGYFGKAGEDDARRVAEGLRKLSTLAHGSAFCAIAEYMWVTAYGECLDGASGACALASEYLNDLLVHCPLS